MVHVHKRGPREDREVRKNRIVKAAFEIIGRKGLRALTFDALAHETGLQKGSVYQSVGKIDQLMELLFDYVVSVIVPMGDRVSHEELAAVWFIATEAALPCMGPSESRKLLASAHRRTAHKVFT
jgi:AcrR family transcriptional regulator